MDTHRETIIIVDADATPRDCLQTVDRLAAKAGAQVITVSSINHEFSRQNHITVDAHPQAVDMEIIRRLNRESSFIVVTQDYGLAALALGKGARALSPKGLIYTEGNIDRLLFERDLSARERRETGRTKGPKARTKNDAFKFQSALQQVLSRVMTGGTAKILTDWPSSKAACSKPPGYALR